MILCEHVHLIVSLVDPPAMNGEKPMAYVRHLIDAIENGGVKIRVHQFENFSPDMAAEQDGTPTTAESFRPQ